LESLEYLAGLLEQRNWVDGEISRLIGRPAYSGHLGEFIALTVFGIRLHESATTKSSDGVFASGALAGKSVNVKYYARMQPLLDMSASVDPADHADYYLVMTGPRGPAASSKGQLLAFSIAAAYLFDSHQLIAEQTRRNVKLGVDSSVSYPLWTAAMIYPEQVNPLLQLTEVQREMLSLFDAGRS